VVGGFCLYLRPNDNGGTGVKDVIWIT